MNRLALLIFAISTTILTSCIEIIEESETDNPAASSRLTFDGASDYFTIDNAARQPWTVTDCPKWITPVMASGLADDSIKFYIESNRRTPLRTANITITYADGTAVTTRAEQTNIELHRDLRRSFAVGWGFDCRTYNDSRGLCDQIFNLQKLDQQYPGIYQNEVSTASDIVSYFGEDASALQNSMSAKLQLGIKATAFSLDLQGNFGMSAITNSKRIFSWMREYFAQRVVYIANPNFAKMRQSLPFTTDFIAFRDTVICHAHQPDADEYFRLLIDNYGTHFVTTANLGGCIDYYYSSVYDDSNENINVVAALEFSYASKFKVQADAKYENDLKTMNNETIEKIVVKGGDAIGYTNAVITGAVKEKDSNFTETWIQSLTDGKMWELIHFNLVPISRLFPNGFNEQRRYIEEDDIEMMIEDYLDRLYYSQVPVTRVARNDIWANEWSK